MTDIGGSLPVNRDEQIGMDDDRDLTENGYHQRLAKLLETNLVIQAIEDLENDPELAAYYRDLAEVNEAIANLYRGVSGG